MSRMIYGVRGPHGRPSEKSSIRPTAPIQRFVAEPAPPPHQLKAAATAAGASGALPSELLLTTLPTRGCPGFTATEAPPHSASGQEPAKERSTRQTKSEVMPTVLAAPAAATKEGEAAARSSVKKKEGGAHWRRKRKEREAAERAATSAFKPDVPSISKAADSHVKVITISPERAHTDPEAAPISGGRRAKDERRGTRHIRSE